MITARFKINDNAIGFEVTGHANYDGHGKDIVCAAVSVLTTAIVNEINHFSSNVSFKENFIRCSFDYNEENHKNHAHKIHLYRLYKMLLDNLQEIEQQYPENIKVVVSNG